MKMYRNESGSLRKILASSAWFAAFVGALSLLFSAYINMSFPKKISLKERVNFIRATVAPRAYILTNFEKDSTVSQSLDKPMRESEFRFLVPENEEIRRAINNFVAPIYGKSYEVERTKIWLNDQSPLGIKWSPLIDDTSANNESNVKLLVRSLILDYLQRLTQLNPVLQSAKYDRTSKSSLDALISPSAYEEMPGFLAWFSANMNKSLATIALETETKEKTRLSLSEWLWPSLETAAVLFTYAVGVTLFLRLPWPVFLVAIVLLTIIGSSITAAWAVKKSAIGIGEIILAFMILIFATNFGLFSASIGTKKASFLKKKIIFDAFTPILLIIFLVSFINANISTYLFFATMALYALAVGYLLFVVKSAEEKGSSRRDERLRSEWKAKLRLIATKLPLNNSHNLVLTLIGYVDSSRTNFIQSDSNGEISERLDELQGILSQPTHNPFVVQSKLLSLKELLIEVMN